MLPKYLRNAIKDWEGFCKTELPSIFDQVQEIKRKHESGEISEEEKEELINKAKAPMVYQGVHPTKKRVIINDLKHLYRYRIRKKVETGLKDLKIFLEHLEEIDLLGFSGSKLMLEPEIMDEICVLWMKLRKEQWLRKIVRERLSEMSLDDVDNYQPPKLNV